MVDDLRHLKELRSVVSDCYHAMVVVIVCYQGYQSSVTFPGERGVNSLQLSMDNLGNGGCNFQ